MTICDKCGERTDSRRTVTQNNSLHLFFQLLSDELNAGGYGVKIVLAKSPEIDWNKDLVKNLLWRPFQQAKLGKDSTTDLSKLADIDMVYDEVNRFISQEFGIFVPFPHDDNPAK